MTTGRSSPDRAPRAWLLAGSCWLAAVITVGLLGATLCPPGACRVTELDREILAALAAARRPLLDALLAPATWLGSLAVLVPAACALWWWRLRQSAVWSATLPVFALGGACLLVHVVKLLVARPRPALFEPLVAMPVDLSFPSAHAAQAGALALAAFFVLPRRFAWAVAAAAAVLVALVALSRVYLQVHYPTDVLAGLLLGVGWAAGLCLLRGNAR